MSRTQLKYQRKDLSYIYFCIQFGLHDKQEFVPFVSKESPTEKKRPKTKIVVIVVGGVIGLLMRNGKKGRVEY